ncbi:MAG: DUF533 domain-containing protein [Polaromonas sp.]|nr:DUF533 domain-containing protein [Polaromonas sp.]
MTSEQQEALLGIALFAAFADGAKADSEREEIRRIAQSLAAESGAPNLPRLYQEVLLKRLKLEAAVQKLSDPSHRQLAYEMAVCVCDADGQQTEAERCFLADLRDQLALEPAQTQAFDAQASALAGIELPGNAALPPVAESAAAVALASSDAELDRSILNHALVNGALELLPQSWASMAIIPLQVKMVYGIGKAHGVSLDQGHVREFIAAAGVGLTSQYLEQFGRKLLGGLLGKIAGKTLGGIGSAGTGMALSFATTYALGQLAKGYYAGGRVMNTALLRETYQGLLEPARQLQKQYLPQIQQKAATLDAAQVMAMVRGK